MKALKRHPAAGWQGWRSLTTLRPLEMLKSLTETKGALAAAFRPDGECEAPQIRRPAPRRSR